MNVAKIRQLLEWIDEAKCLIEAELETGEQKSAIKTKAKKPQKPRGAIHPFDAHVEILKTVTHELQESWVALYGDVFWINSEIQKCHNWCRAKGVRTKKWGLRINNWLNNAVKSKLTANPKQKDTFNKIVAD